MGPRRYRRGWWIPKRTPAAGSRLQWGRDVIVADGVVGRIGWLDNAGFNGAATLSSRMGDTSSSVRRAGYCFNGAATLSSRMGFTSRAKTCWRIASMGPRRYRRGWGTAAAGPHQHPAAASMGPRRYRRGWSTRAPRASSVLEGFNGAATLSSRMDLCVRYQSPRIRSLQWGRDVIVADGISPGAARSAGTQRFNGAATLSSRMAAHGH